jgi:hypothetical protein
MKIRTDAMQSYTDLCARMRRDDFRAIPAGDWLAGFDIIDGEGEIHDFVLDAHSPVLTGYPDYVRDMIDDMTETRFAFAAEFTAAKNGKAMGQCVIEVPKEKVRVFEAMRRRGAVSVELVVTSVRKVEGE